MNHLEGERFGNLVVIEYDKEKKKWKCQCDCGNITYVATKNLKTGNTVSCGCQKNAKGKTRLGDIEEKLQKNNIGQLKVLSIDKERNKAHIHCLQCNKDSYIPLDNLIDMYKKKKVSYTCGLNGCSYTRQNKHSQIYHNVKNGDRFGKLTILKRIENKIAKSKNGYSSIPMFLCKCDCGNVVSVQGRYLLNQSTRSCGCMKLDNFSTKPSYTHIKTQENGKKLYDIYRKWKEKFRSPSPMFKREVIDKGIKFFPELADKKNPFELFYQWAILNGFSKEKRFLDRENYLKDFSSDNCFWTSIRTKGY